MKILDLKTFNEKLKINPINVLDLDNTKIDYEHNIDDFMENICWNDDTGEGVLSDKSGMFGNEDFGLYFYFWSECGWIFYDDYDFKKHEMIFHTDIFGMYAKKYVKRLNFDAYSLTTQQASILSKMGITSYAYDKPDDSASHGNSDYLYFPVYLPERFVTYFRTKFNHTWITSQCNTQVEIEQRESGIGKFASLKLTVTERLLTKTNVKDLYTASATTEKTIRKSLQQALSSVAENFVDVIENNI